MSESAVASRRLRLEAIDRQTPLTRLFTFGPATGSTLDDFEFEPGQVLIFETSEGIEAYIAIASAPGERGSLQFLIKNAGGFGEALFAAEEGFEIEVRGPVGKGFPVDELEGRDLVLVAQGTAVGAVRSAIAHAISKREKYGRIALVYGVRTPDDFNLIGDIDRWRGRDVIVELTCTQPGDQWVGAAGRVQTLMAEALRHALEPAVLVAGSLAMMDECSDVLRELGISEDMVFRNY